MQRYAMVVNGVVQRIVTGTKPHPDALPVVYPTISEDPAIYHITQKHFSEWTVKDTEVEVTYDIVEKDLEEEKEKKRKTSYERMHLALGPVRDTYADEERESWWIQFKQATEFKADENATTPLLDRLAEKRGFTRDEMATRIMENAEMYEDVAGKAIGRKDALLDEIEAAADLTALDAVNPYSGWPEV